jgi:hypothetical protein
MPVFRLWVENRLGLSNEENVVVESNPGLTSLLSRVLAGFFKCRVVAQVG